MEPGSNVVNLDVFEHVCDGYLACCKSFAVDRFDLEAVVSALHSGIVIAVASGTHARNQTVFVEQLAVLCSREQYWLPRSLCMKTPRGILRTNSAMRIAHQSGRHARGYRPANHLT